MVKNKKDIENNDDYKKNSEERIKIKGAPGRKSFKVIPKKMKKFWREEAL